MAGRWSHEIAERGADHRGLSDSETAIMSDSGEESDDDLDMLGDELPPALMSLNQPRRRSRGSLHGDSGASPIAVSDATGDEDDVIIASTPADYVRSTGSQQLRTSNPQLRASRRVSVGSREVGGDFMRSDQTAIPYGPRRAGRGGIPSTRSFGEGPGGLRRIAQTSRGGADTNAEGAGRRVLRDISNVDAPSGGGSARMETRKRSRQTGLWTDSQLARAMQAVEGGMRIQTAANLYKIPPSSLRDHLYGVTRGRKRGGKCVLSSEEEQLIKEWIIELQQRGHPITLSSLRMKVAEICQGRETPFTEGIPGRGWLRWWRRRHPELSLRVAQGLETSRARGLCEENVKTFYTNLKQLYDTNLYSSDRIWNCDETGAQAGRNGGALVLARRGTRTVHQVMPDEREWLSVLVCVNAAGQAIPSFYVFKGKRFRRNYIASCESGATMAMQPRAWMTSFLFSKWISHFVKSVEKFGGISCERRHLLILDGHASHVSIDTVVEARRQGLDLLTLPSHTSHAMQPLDVCLFKPFKTAFKIYRDFWTYRAAGRAAKKENLAQWVSLALRRSLTVQNIEKGFRVTGIWPWNGNAMAAKMGPSQTYRREVEEVGDALTGLEVEEIQQDVSEPQNPENHHFYVDIDGPEREHGDGAGEVGSNEEMPPPGEPAPSITRLLTLPEVTVTRSKRRVEPLADYSKSVILTSENYITMMEEKAARREAVEKAKEEKRQHRELEKKRKEETKRREVENKKIREEERLRKKAFDVAWAPAALSAYGQQLHDRIKSGEPLPANTFRAPFCGFPPSICKENQRLALERRRAKRRRLAASHIPPANPPDWVHRPGAPLWSRVVNFQALNPTWARSPEAIRHLYMRPYEEGGVASESSSRAFTAVADLATSSPIAGVVTGELADSDSLGSTETET